MYATWPQEGSRQRKIGALTPERIAQMSPIRKILAVRSRVIPAFVALLIGLASWQAAAAEPTDGSQDPNQILFEKGMKALRSDQLFSAIEAFQQILSNAPDLHRARLELAVAYYRALDYDKARKAAEKVLKDPHVPPNVRVSILAFLAQVNEDQKKLDVPSRFTPFVSVGTMYDSNVNIGPISDIVPYQGQLLTVLPSSAQERHRSGALRRRCASLSTRQALSGRAAGGTVPLAE